jgi:hypothetical protein
MVIKDRKGILKNNTEKKPRSFFRSGARGE